MQHPAANWDTGLEHAEISDVGMRRSNNQDSYTLLLAKTPDLWQRRGHIFMVADGMGAHAAGEYASKLAVDNVPHTYHKLLDDAPATAIRKAIEEANHIIHSRGQANFEFQGMGTTSSALVFLPQGAMVAHVGDSRVYRLRGTRLDQLTFDHSLVWELMASGQVGSNEVPGYIPKNIITRSLGPNPEVKVDVEGPFPVAVGDTYLLCSDGLTGQVENEELGAILGALPPQEAVRTLVDLANLRGGPDNITMIVVRVAGGPGAATLDASAAAEDIFAVPKPRIHPGWWGAAAALGLASAGLFAASLPLPAIGLAAAGALVMVGALLRQAQSAAPGDDAATANQHGRAPYASAQAAFNDAFVDELERILEELRDAATQEDWVVDWSKINLCTARAIEGAKQKNFVVAVREYCRAISVLMDELRHQRKAKA
jgi:protein phosphatase